MNERSLVPELNLVDVVDDAIWLADGGITLVYRVNAYHEPGLDECEFDAVAEQAEGAWAGLPENTSYQYYVLVSHGRAAQALRSELPPIPNQGVTSQLFEEIRQLRMKELLKADTTGGTTSLIQERRHFLCATFHPQALKPRGLFSTRVVRSPQEVYKEALREADIFDRRVVRGLRQQGLEFLRCDNPQILRFLHDLLNPTTADLSPLDELSPRHRREDRFSDNILHECPWAQDVHPLWNLVDDDLRRHPDHLQIGDQHVAIVTIKDLPNTSTPGLLVPLLRLGLMRYRVYVRLDIPRMSTVMASLHAKANLAEGLKFARLFTKTNRSDPHAKLVGEQADDAMIGVLRDGSRVFGVTWQIVLMEKERDKLDEAVQEVLGVTSRMNGLRGYRETFLAKPVWLSQVPGNPAFTKRQRRAMSRETVEMMPLYDFRATPGRIPLATADNSITYFDPFETSVCFNPHILITGTTGAGKSVAAQTLISSYEIACAARGDARPHVFILDMGGSYRRYMECRDDGRYVAFSFADPPGVNVFEFDPSDAKNDADRLDLLDTHVSRLEGLLIDLFKVDPSNEEEFDRRKAVLQRALYTLYRKGGSADWHFQGFAQVLADTPGGESFLQSLYPFVEGKFARYFVAKPQSALGPDVHAICYDFGGLAEHEDLKVLALRLTIYEIRRFSSMMLRRQRRRTFVVGDECWALLSPGSAGRSGELGASFIVSTLRMGRKEGMSVIAMSQQIEDFAMSAHGAAIIGNAATKFVGPPGKGGLKGLREHLNLTTRQIEQVQRLNRTESYQEFLLAQDATSNVVRISLDPISRWLFTTSATDLDRLADVARQYPHLSQLERVRLLARETEGAHA